MIKNVKGRKNIKKFWVTPQRLELLDPQIKSLLLYQLSYGVIFIKKITNTVTSLNVTRPGFEPRQAESESAVLPLYYRAINHKDKILWFYFFTENYFNNISFHYCPANSLKTTLALASSPTILRSSGGQF